MGITATNRVKWKDTFIGDHAYLTFAFHGNVDIRVIPRAKGVRIRSTEELGGGYFSISVKGIKAGDNRAELEEYFKTLDASLELNEKGTLTVYNTNGSVAYTLTDCYLQSFDQEENDLKVNTFTAEFIKSL